jgi:tRNA (mo5U34)-methyltransferase
LSATDAQAEIDRITWYHEFDFPGGLRARSSSTHANIHRAIWKFIERNLEPIDFRGKTVLDVGCWDGYWSFYAERRGAERVLASDDVSQSWAEGAGLRLARELFQSSVEINQHLSVHRLGSLNRKFDIILCLGVYYHLFDPFHAFAQLRHCCHPGTVVLLEGDVAANLPQNEARYCLDDATKPAFVPSESALEQLLAAAYLRVVAKDRLNPPRTDLKSRVARWVRGQSAGSYRGFFVCTPVEGVNSIHHYAPPFRLGTYDDRFRSSALPIAET